MKLTIYVTDDNDWAVIRLEDGSRVLTIHNDDSTENLEIAARWLGWTVETELVSAEQFSELIETVERP